MNPTLLRIQRIIHQLIQMDRICQGEYVTIDGFTLTDEQKTSMTAQYDSLIAQLISESRTLSSVTDLQSPLQIAAAKEVQAKDNP